MDEPEQGEKQITQKQAYQPAVIDFQETLSRDCFKQIGKATALKVIAIAAE